MTALPFQTAGNEFSATRHSLGIQVPELPNPFASREDDSSDDVEKDQIPNAQHVGEDDEGERECLQHRQCLRDDEGAVAVPAIDQDPGKGGKKKKLQLPGEADQAEQPA